MRDIFKILFCTFLFVSGLNAKSLPAPLKGDKYKEVLSEYFKEALANVGDFNSHKFEKFNVFLEKYCNLGLPEACGDLGGNYALGLGATRDVRQAKKHIKYAIDNVSGNVFRDVYKNYFEIVKNIESYDGKEAIKHIKTQQLAHYIDCTSNKGNKDSCFKAYIYSIMLPEDMFYIDLLGKGWMEAIFEAEFQRNGAANSKLFQIISESLMVDGVEEYFQKSIKGNSVKKRNDW